MLTALIAVTLAFSQAQPERLTPAEARRLPGSGQLGTLCPVPDVPMDFREQVSRVALMRAHALLLEVRNRPDALVTMTYQDAHTGEPFTETLTVRALAQEHLENPGVEGVPCHRKLMTRLKAAVEGTPVPEGVVNDPVFTLDGIVKGLRLDKRGGVYFSPDGCEVGVILFSRDEVRRMRRERIRNNVVIASARGRIGVFVYKPDRRCRTGIRQDLNRLERRARP